MGRVSAGVKPGRTELPTTSRIARRSELPVCLPQMMLRLYSLSSTFLAARAEGCLVWWRPVCWSGWVLSLAAVAVAGPGSQQEQFFRDHVHPILAAHCYECHSQPEALESNLSLDRREQLLQGGERGPAIVPGDPAASLLVRAIRHTDEDLAMPPTGKLADEAIQAIEVWIRDGAIWPADLVVAPSSIVAHDPMDHWAYRYFQSISSPSVGDTRGIRNKVDAFVRAHQEDAGVAANPQATQQVLIRRLSFDLRGLPPTPGEVRQFASDRSPHAYTRLVDRWLASPHFGERWASMWLGLARYGEDQAHNNDGKKSLPHAWRYRDWVISAFNRDVPYDRFVQLQLAADHLGPAAHEERAALGFLGLGAQYYNGKRLDVMADEWEDRVDTTTRTFLGLTVACARCHDHKFDAITMADYYALAGIFASTEMTTDNDTHLVRDGKLQDLPLFARGDVQQPGELVARRFLTVLGGDRGYLFQRGSGRLELAESITDPRNPLVARVIVNRVWDACFGEPLVATPSNFGAVGTLPTHPRLLDDLAARFVDSGWSIKWLVRELVLSQTYRQSSAYSISQDRRDPKNRLLWRMHRRRLPVEAWRDSLLAATAELDVRLGGPSQDLQDEKNRRRTIYGTVSRATPDAMLRQFDFPDANVHHARRELTVTPLQKLFVMNSPFMHRQATRLVSQLPTDATDRARIAMLYWKLFARPPTTDELNLAGAFLSSQPDWQGLAHVLLSANEMMYVD